MSKENVIVNYKKKVPNSLDDKENLTDVARCYSLDTITEKKNTQNCFFSFWECWKHLLDQRYQIHCSSDLSAYLVPSSFMLAESAQN